MTKSDLRKALKERRAALSDEQRNEWDAAIIANLLRSDLFQNASMLLLYVPMEGEIALLPLARAARSLGKPIAFPRCDVQTNTMAFHILKSDMRLSPGAYGIPEPPEDAPLCIPDEHALCILPGLSFDLSGNRLGYGKGYYDRYLSDFPGVTVGAVYTQMMRKTLPTDANDIPADYLVTECGLRSLAPTSATAESERNIPSRSWAERVKQTATSVFRTCRQWVLRAHANGIDGIKAPHAPPLLVFCTFVLLLLSHLIDTAVLNRDNEYIGAILLQLLIFVIPAILYCKLRGEKFTDRIRMHPIRLSHLPFVLCMLVLMITGSLLTSVLTGGIASLSGNFTLYGTFVAHTASPMDIVYSILAYALLPAIGEELIYRSVLCAEYERYGVGVSVAVSSLFFAMLHFSIPLFPPYLLLGIFLSCSLYATRSFFTPFLLHLCYNGFCLFGQPYLSAFYINAGSNEIFVFCLGVLFLLFAAFATGEARKIYHIYAQRNTDSSYTVSIPLKQYPKRILGTLFTPVFLACLLTWLITAIVNLF